MSLGGTECEEWEICEEQPADTNTGAQKTEEDATATDPAVFNLVWGVYTSWMVVLGGLLQSKYSSFAKDVATDTTNLSTYANWTETWIEEADPIAAWFLQAKVMIGFYGIGWFLWAINMGVDNTGGPVHVSFLYFSKASVLAPIITLILTLINYMAYEDCDDTTVQAKFTDSAATIASCKGGNEAEYGATGSIAALVKDDPRS